MERTSTPPPSLFKNCLISRGPKHPLDFRVVAVQALVYIKLRAEFATDKAANGLEMVIPFPKEVQRVSCDVDKEAKPAGMQTWDWQEKARRLVWKFKKVQGGSEHTLKVGSYAPARTPLLSCLLGVVYWFVL